MATSIVSRLTGGLLGGNGSTIGTDPRTYQHIQRAHLYKRHWEYYLGDQPMPLKTKPGSPDHNVIENWSSVIVDQSLNFLFGPGVDFELAREDDSDGPDDAQLALDALWATDPRTGFNKSVFLQELGQNGGVCGTCYIRIFDDDIPLVRNINPSSVDIVYNPDDVDEVYRYDIVWKGDGVWHRHRLELADSGSWEIYEEEHSGGGWEIKARSTWPYPTRPMYHAKNLPLANTVYGLSDLRNKRMNDAVNRVASDINKTNFYYASPTTIFKGVPPQMVRKTSIEGGWSVPATDGNNPTDVYNLEMTGDLAASRQAKEDNIDTLFETSQNVRVNPERVSVGALSGFALRILYGPLISLTKKKRQTYGTLLLQVNHAMLTMMGHGDALPDLVWGEMLPVSRQEQATELNMYTNSGANIHGAALVAGYTEEEAQLLSEVDLGVLEQ